MIRILSALMFFVLMAVSAQAEMRRVNSPGDGYLNLRTGPGSSYDIVRRMTHGAKVDVLEAKGGWLRVRHRTSGREGWAYSKYLVRPKANTLQRRVYSPGDGFLNLRSGPGGDFKILRRMHHGDRVRILERKGSWVRVRHSSGAQGWAFAKYLRQ
ncbi:SH3 domain-containing protein [Rhodobacteraceae bacterium D3-12]|nr:SH3 domain-containing protein [Rhodobacteraceae bacterium D3-12]